MWIAILALCTLLVNCVNLNTEAPPEDPIISFGDRVSERQVEQEFEPIIISNDKFYGFEFGKRLNLKGSLIRKSIDEKSNCPRVSYVDTKGIFDSVIFVLCDNKLVKISLLKQKGDFKHVFEATRDKLFEDFSEALFTVANYWSNNPPLQTLELNLFKDEVALGSKYRTWLVRCEKKTGSYASYSPECKKFNFAIGKVISKVWLTRSNVVFVEVNSHEYDARVSLNSDQIKRNFDK